MGINMKKANNLVRKYIPNINPITVSLVRQLGEWKTAHGDSKSSTDGRVSRNTTADGYQSELMSHVLGFP